MIRMVLVGLAFAGLTACTTTERVGLPSQADIAALTEAKPVPSVAILTDPAASDRYSSEVEGWGDRLSAAGGRLCRFYQTVGMHLDCPAK